MTDTTTAAPVIGANKNGKPVAPNEGARKNPVAPVAGTTNDGADDTQAPPALVDELKSKYRFDSKTRRGQELTKYEGIIERGLYTFIEVGTALAAIRDKHLYREYLEEGNSRHLRSIAKIAGSLATPRARQSTLMWRQSQPLPR